MTTTRRTFATVLAAAAAAPVSAAAPRTKMGIATTSFATRRSRNTIDFLEYCHTLGAGGIQASLFPLDSDAVKKLRARAEELGMYIEIMIGIPRQGIEQFEATVKAAKEAGALCARAACLGGRRYETFNTLDDWKKFVAESKAALDRAVPVLERYKFRLAVENHKDWTTEDFVALLKQYSSPYFGACLDTGNNISLLDDTMELAEAIAPYAVTTHIKDMGVQTYDEGFLLSEVPFGDGYVDLKRVVSLVAKHRPETKFNLEMMTRDPLKVPCLTEKYWVTFPGRGGSDLARMMTTVRTHASRKALPAVQGMERDARARYEEDNVKLCLNYSRVTLGV